MDNNNMLDQKIESVRRTISADGYGMSVGELCNMYSQKELIIRPEFQRLFRWDDTQKTHLIESLLIGIPLPSIFVAQREDGVWELVDGLQRMSTILQFQGLLREEDGSYTDPLVLKGTRILPELEGMVWEATESHKSLSRALQLDFKRSKIDVKIIKRESSTEAKYDLFQRLNSYGSVLTAQEMRNAIIVGANPELYAWLRKLAEHPSFEEVTGLTETKLKKGDDTELVLRFLHLHNLDGNKINRSSLGSYSETLDDYSLVLATKSKREWKNLEEVFIETFDKLQISGGFDMMRRWDPVRDRFVGGFLSTSYEVFAIGLGYHICHGNKVADLPSTVKSFWAETGAADSYSSGKNTEARLTVTIPKGRKLLKT